MARKYPHYVGYTRRLKGPSEKPCVVCGQPGWVWAEVQVGWFRGDDEYILLCKGKECRTATRLNPAAYLKVQRVMPMANELKEGTDCKLIVEDEG